MSTLCCAGEIAGGFNVEETVIRLGQSRDCGGDAGRVNDCVDVGQGSGKVLRASEIANNCARRHHLDFHRTAQQHSAAVAALGQFAKQMTTDETSGPGKGDEGSGT
jgi:hypothetical protein